MVSKIFYENKSLVVIHMKGLKKYLVKKEGSTIEKIIYATDEENAIKFFYVPSLKKLKSTFPYESKGYVEEVDTGDYTPYTFKYYKEETEINLEITKIGPLKRELKIGWIPKKMKKWIYLKSESLHEPLFMSFPDMMIGHKPLRVIMINPKTNQILISMLGDIYSTHATYVKENEKNPFKDFIMFDMFEYNKNKERGAIKVVTRTLLDMKNEEKSRHIIKALNMLIINGINIKSNINFTGMKGICTIDYFLKTKVMW